MLFSVDTSVLILLISPRLGIVFRLQLFISLHRLFKLNNPTCPIFPTTHPIVVQTMSLNLTFVGVFILEIVVFFSNREKKKKKDYTEIIQRY